MESAAPASTNSPSTDPTPAAAPAAARTDKPEPAASGWNPRLKRALIGVGILVVLAALAVIAARWARTMPAVQEFLVTHPGHAPQPESAPTGMPPWMGWQHFFNMFFIVLIIRTGLAVRTEKRPPGYWQPPKKSFFSPHGGDPKKVSLSQWLHQVLDVAWVVNGLIFVTLLIVTGHWMRIVPTSVDLIPNMASTLLQYASLNWPVENGWVHYNALQQVAYFVTVFIAAPLAVITGARMSTWWPTHNATLNKAYPIEVARALHFPVMIYFVAFTVAHVFLVFFTGALRNLNHMYTSRDVVDIWGLVVFLVSVAVIAGAWFLSGPTFTTPIATKMGKVTKN
ncbi:MAG: cytochrome b/b6 domain-containing protein [Propionibacteriaceae bacterium]|nr:cytochrome b/b6 domain-containing protein [Propionibacteriaceae bacterium]